MLARLPGSELTFVGLEAGPKRADTGRLAPVADAAIEEHPAPDVVLIPGGEGKRPLMGDERVALERGGELG